MTSRDNIRVGGRRDGAFVELLSRNRRPLFRFIFSLVHSMADAEDVFQKTAITLWDKFDQFDPESDFFAWATTVARYKALSFFQAKGRERMHFSDAVIEQLASHDEWPSESHVARLQALASCREKLSAKDRELLAGCYGGHGTILEAARELGRPVGSVYDSLTRIRRALYACIQRTLAAEGQP